MDGAKQVACPIYSSARERACEQGKEEEPWPRSRVLELDKGCERGKERVFLSVSWSIWKGDMTRLTRRSPEALVQ